MHTYKIVKAFFALLLFQSTICQEKPAITVFIHGTLPPIINHVIHKLEAPLGLSKAKDLDYGIIHKHIASIISQADGTMFPLEHIYFFGWSGNLSVSDRLTEAHNLYHALEKLDGTITLICHSHGCNIALNLAAVAAKRRDSKLIVDRLILLAGPVQEATKRYVHSPIFKEIFSFYSSSDLIQVIDPQGLQRKNFGKKRKHFFSQRLWPADKKNIQTKASFTHRPLLHIDFILTDFLQYLPKAVKQLAQLKNSYIQPNYYLKINTKENTIKISTKP